MTTYPEIKVTEVDGKIESTYLIFPGFRPDVHHALETLVFGSVPVQLLIDVGENDFPLAMQTVAQVDPAMLPKLPTPTETQVKEVTDILYAFANQMIAYHRANHPKKGTALAPKVMDGVRSLVRAKNSNLAVA